LQRDLDRQTCFTLADRQQKNRTYIDQSSKFFSIPAELRTEIYEFCLIEEDSIAIIHSLKVPPLLQVSQQIRSEASRIWYQEDQFQAKVHGCKYLRLSRWATHCTQVNQREYRLKITTFGRLDWNRLMHWCKAIWKSGGDARMLTDTEGDRLGDRVIRKALAIGLEFQDRDWSQCRQVLKKLPLYVDPADRVSRVDYSDSDTSDSFASDREWVTDAEEEQESFCTGLVDHTKW
jgi:hypothetical protein